ncbi:hypothetical protein NDNC_0200 [Candidatus Nasuia deltocephalinicola]|uniref:50S ribosomal protein L35 n=1 Tax=Candidatus Nasuia deltocephalincola TaxID=1160784 RepID=A0A974WKP3_9PROT|nr:50S ribosomal protein L35 [Candidatus Nasuia deltocephalinicola]WKD87082.1 50S ribosomal protein L35 [Candidatus Nasuia deltocephalinicola]BEH03854.1 hypothetical protein NDNC_0200 [Candidatus Nasuia deltocephalinicola]
MLKLKLKKSILKRFFYKNNKNIKVFNSNKNHLLTNKSRFSKKNLRGRKIIKNLWILNKF